MQIEVFNKDWLPDKNMGVEDNKDFVREVHFGNGVTQLQKTVLGSCPKIYNLTFTNSADVIADIDTFLERNTGKFFFWDIPMENRRIKVYHSEKSKSMTGIIDTLTFKLTEVR